MLNYLSAREVIGMFSQGNNAVSPIKFDCDGSPAKTFINRSPALTLLRGQL